MSSVRLASVFLALGLAVQTLASECVVIGEVGSNSAGYGGGETNIYNYALQFYQNGKQLNITNDSSADYSTCADGRDHVLTIEGYPNTVTWSAYCDIGEKFKSCTAQNGNFGSVISGTVGNVQTTDYGLGVQVSDACTVQFGC